MGPPGWAEQVVYEHTAKPLIEFVLNGYNATVFAYGATGTVCHRRLLLLWLCYVGCLAVWLARVRFGPEVM